MLSPLSRYENLIITTREALQPLCDELIQRRITSIQQLTQWMQDVSDIESIIQEDATWRYIQHSRDTTDTESKQHYEYHLEHIQPQLESRNNELNKIITSHPLINQLPDEYTTIINRIRLYMSTFHMDNIELHTKCEQYAQQYMSLSGWLTIEHDNKTLTMQQASEYLQQPDRETRRIIYEKQAAERSMISWQIDDILSQLISIRHKISINAGFNSYIEYRFAELWRLDYTTQDCQHFADAIQQYITPLCIQTLQQRKKELWLDSLMPYDLSCDTQWREKITSFSSIQDMLSATKTITNAIDPRFKDLIELLEDNQLLDLETRKNKQPGWYNTSLLKSGLSFIFSNSACNSYWLGVLWHELGHAMHSYRMRNLPYYELQQVPMEIAEVASMSMEWIMQDYMWLIYSPEQTQRLKQEKIIDTIQMLCHVAVIDRFQDRLYRNPHHSIDQRHDKYKQLYTTYRWSEINRDDYTEMYGCNYHKQLHIREVPLYYIEYGIAELWAIGVCINTQKNKQQWLNQYFSMLDAWYTKPLAQLYQLWWTELWFDDNSIKKVSGRLQEQLW